MFNCLISIDMNCKMALPISNHVWLIDQPKSSANIFYFGGNRSSGTNCIEHIYLHMVSESQPEKRLHTLLTKGMLTEAEVKINPSEHFLLFSFPFLMLKKIPLGISSKVSIGSAADL